MEMKTKWIIDPAHSEVTFKVRHLMITNIKGEFKDFSADIYTTGDDFSAAEIKFNINPASIETRNADRDAHLKSPDFFDVEQFKEITFVADAMEKENNKGDFKLSGDLTIKGITRKVKLDVEFGGVMKDPWGAEKAGFTVTGKINRKEWGLNWNTTLETGGVLVSDEINISCDVQLVKSVDGQ